MRTTSPTPGVISWSKTGGGPMAKPRAQYKDLPVQLFFGRSKVLFAGSKGLNCLSAVAGFQSSVLKDMRFAIVFNPGVESSSSN